MCCVFLAASILGSQRGFENRLHGRVVINRAHLFLYLDVCASVCYMHVCIESHGRAIGWGAFNWSGRRNCARNGGGVEGAEVIERGLLIAYPGRAAAATTAEHPRTAACACRSYRCASVWAT